MVVSVFVNNLPLSVHWRWLKRVFMHFGRVVDVFIPHKRSSQSCRFGFVRFESLGEANRAIWNLNGVWLLDKRIGVNLARYHPREKFWRKKSYNLSNGQETESAPRVSLATPKVTSNTDQPVNNRKSFAQVLQEGLTDKVSSPQLKKGLAKDESLFCVGDVECENLHWLEKSIVGTCNGFTDVGMISEQIRCEGISSLIIRRISGKVFLITFQDDDLFEGMKEEGWSWLNRWFHDIKPWTKDVCITSRRTWVACYGVPIHAWCLSTFQSIASLVGEFVCMDGDTLKMKSFFRGAVQIICNTLHKIDDFIDLKVGDLMYKIRVSEVEPELVSLFPCCLKYQNQVIPKEIPAHSSDTSSSSGHGHGIEQDEESSSGMRTSPHIEKDDQIVNLDEANFNGNCGVDRLDAPLSNTDLAKVTSPKDVGGGSCQAIEAVQVDCVSPENQNVDGASLNGLSDNRYATQPGLSNCSLGDQDCFSQGNNANWALCTVEPEEDVFGSYVSDSDENRQPNMFSHQKEKKWRYYAEIEEKLCESLGKKSKKVKKKLKKRGNSSTLLIDESPIANASLTDDDIQHRNNILRREAVEIWNLGKQLGLEARCDEEVILGKLQELEKLDVDRRR